MRYEHFDEEIRDGVAVVRFTGPGAAALSDLSDEFLDLMLRLQEDNLVRVMLVTDGDQAFPLPRDLDALTQERTTEHGLRLLAADLECVRRIVTLIQETGKPVITATRGAVRGAGLGLFMAGDVRLASDTATFKAPDLASGLMPDWGLTFVLPRSIGPGRTLDLLWSGRTIGAAEAESMGLVDRIIDDAAWDEELLAYVARLTQLPQPAVRLTKLAAQQAPQHDLTSMLSYEYEAQQQCWVSPETAEGLVARNEGRAPVFPGPTAGENDD